MYASTDSIKGYAVVPMLSVKVHVRERMSVSNAIEIQQLGIDLSR